MQRKKIHHGIHIFDLKKFQTYITTLSKSQFINLWEIDMKLECPRCGSKHIHTKNTAKKLGGSVGLLAGASAGLVSAASGARSGALIGSFAGPVGVSLGSIGGAILGGLAGATSGGIAGSKLGEKIDKKVLLNYQCHDCCHSFSDSDISNAEDK